MEHQNLKAPRNSEICFPKVKKIFKKREDFVTNKEKDAQLLCNFGPSLRHEKLTNFLTDEKGK